MGTSGQLHDGLTRLLSLVMAIVGIALIVQAATGEGGGLISGRLLLGVLFVAAGAGRLWVQVRRRRAGSGDA